MLEVKEVTKRFGGLTALNNVNFSVRENSLSALIGPNGAGKTTLLNIITGMDAPDRGAVFLSGIDISNMSSLRRSRQGISRTFQHLELFGDMTLLENIMVGRYSKTKSGFISSGLRLPFAVKEEEETRRRSKEILEYINLGHRANDISSNLPIGEQRTLEIGRALATEPRFLLLDEPAAGLNIKETRSLGCVLQRIRSEMNITIILVEHDMDLVMQISDRITVLNFGEILAEGPPHEIQKDPAVIAAYLGVDDE
ncbi:MAG: ABC transporter ATP-binding protein [Dissulfurispiraceae bacterium]